MFIESAVAIPVYLTLPPAWRGDAIGDAAQDSEGVPAVWRTIGGWAFGYESLGTALLSRTVLETIEQAQQQAIKVTRESCEA